jgi:plasmid stability protein
MNADEVVRALRVRAADSGVCTSYDERMLCRAAADLIESLQAKLAAFLRRESAAGMKHYLSEASGLQEVGEESR